MPRFRRVFLDRPVTLAAVLSRRSTLAGPPVRGRPVTNWQYRVPLSTFRTVAPRSRLTSRRYPMKMSVGAMRTQSGILPAERTSKPGFGLEIAAASDCAAPPLLRYPGPTEPASQGMTEVLWKYTVPHRGPQSLVQRAADDVEMEKSGNNTRSIRVGVRAPAIHCRLLIVRLSLSTDSCTAICSPLTLKSGWQLKETGTPRMGGMCYDSEIREVFFARSAPRRCIQAEHERVARPASPLRGLFAGGDKTDTSERTTLDSSKAPSLN